MTTLPFTSSKISDQKRLVRGEQLLLARSCLRARDAVHHARWRVLTMAGGSPKGEVAALRELMPKAHIVAVDREARCLDAAIEAGVDDVVHCDLTAWADEPYMRDGWRDGKYVHDVAAVRPRPPAAIQRAGPFDLINLDLCGGVNATAREIVEQYRRLVTPRGVVIVTFSYGRDVVELFVAEVAQCRQLAEKDSSAGSVRSQILATCEAQKVPELLVGRLIYLLPLTDLGNLASVMVYRGNEMPMCSCLYTLKNKLRVGKSFSYVQVAHGDLELAAAFPDAAKLYDCPQERILSLRRQFAAFKAHLTRRQSSERPAGPLFALQDQQ